MPAVLIAKLDQREVARLKLDKPQSVIGRSTRADLVLDHADVSRRHALVARGEQGFTLSDMGSRNGLGLNGHPLETPTILADNDQIALGPYVVVFHENLADEAAGDDEHADAPTRFISPQDLKKVLPGKPVVARSKTDPIRAKVVLLDGPLQNAKFEHWTGDLTIGRHLENNVVLMDDAVSNYHARIFRQGDDFCIEDLGSSNGTFVRGVRCVNQKLRNRDRIRIGATTLAFTRIDVRQQKKLRWTALLAATCALVLIPIASLFVPDDAAALAADRGLAYLHDRNYEDARTEFGKCLRLDPTHEVALRGMKSIRAREKRLGIEEEAKQALEAGHYDRAIELCGTIIDNYSPSDATAAIALKNAAQRLNDAQIALDNENWTDSVRILKELEVEFPDVKITRRLKQTADMELRASQSLEKAKDAAGRIQTDQALTILKDVPSNSRYKVQAGELGKSLEWVKELEKVLESEQVADLRKFDAELAKDLHPLQPAGIKPGPYRERIRLRIQNIAADRVNQAAKMLRDGDRQKAYDTYNEALSIDPHNPSAQAGLDNIRTLVEKDCRPLAIEARRALSVGKKDLAREYYRRMLSASLPGDVYNDKAKKALEELAR